MHSTSTTWSGPLALSGSEATTPPWNPSYLRPENLRTGAPEPPGLLRIAIVTWIKSTYQPPESTGFGRFTKHRMMRAEAEALPIASASSPAGTESWSLQPRTTVRASDHSDRIERTESSQVSWTRDLATQPRSTLSLTQTHLPVPRDDIQLTHAHSRNHRGRVEGRVRKINSPGNQERMPPTAGVANNRRRSSRCERRRRDEGRPSTPRTATLRAWIRNRLGRLLARS